MAVKQIAYKGHDLRIYGRPGDYYFNDLSLGNHTNDFLLYVIDHHIAGVMYALDIGANIGLTTAVLAKSLPGSKILSFEPDPQTFSFLTDTVEANDLLNCTPYQIALGDRPGELMFMSDPNDSTGNRLAPEGIALGGGNRKVKVERLDDFLSEVGFPRVDFIKLDVEGFELEVLRGATKTLQAFKPNLFIEFNSFTLIAFGNHNPRDLLDYLRTKFPFVYRFVDGQPQLIETSQDEMDFIHTNLVLHGCVDDLYCTHEAIPS